MQGSGWLQLAFYIVVLALITKPMGLYLMQVLDAKGKTWLDPVLRPLERGTYRVMGVDPNREHDWKQYTLAMLLFSLVGMVFTYLLLRLQATLPFQLRLNPQTIVQERQQLRVGYGQYTALRGLSYLGRGSVARIITDYQAGQSWSEIAQSNGSRVNDLTAWIGDVMRTTNDRVRQLRSQPYRPSYQIR